MAFVLLNNKHFKKENKKLEIIIIMIQIQNRELEQSFFGIKNNFRVDCVKSFLI